MFSTAIALRHVPRQNGQNGETPMLTTWNALSEELQLALAQQALLRAVQTVADQAETLADVMDDGELSDRGGPDALRLLAALVRATGPTITIGHA